jgi:hypothetical protein
MPKNRLVATVVQRRPFDSRHANRKTSPVFARWRRRLSQ